MRGALRGGCAVAYLALGSVVGVAGCGAHSFRATEILVLTASADEVDRLDLDNRVGDIRVVGDPLANTITARVTKIGRGISPAEAQAALTEINVFLQEGAEGLEAGVKHPHHSTVRSWEIQWDITAPPKLALELRSNVGEIAARDVNSGVVVSTDVGDVSLANVRGGVVVAADVGDIRVEDVEGEARLETSVGDIRLSFISPSAMPVRAVTDVGSIRVDLSAEQKGRLTVKVGVGDLHVNLGSTPMTNLQHSRDSIRVDLHGASAPDMVMRTSVGNVTVMAH
ncbi:MAG: DUF4097 family beta strand repeat protein [Phycisphaerales bacterium]|nr:MAG: DUF4097 family beta strand repeat protein [Phycisphaerales bacterium]